MTHNLKVVGAGHLGVRVAHLWKLKFPDAEITLATRRNEPQRTAAWKTLGYKVSSREEEESGTLTPVKVPYVVFCAPPTGNADYAKGIETSVQTDYDATSPHGAYLFTSSSGVYSENTGGVVTETSPVASTVERYALILQGEKHVLAAPRGIVLRFAGLYSKTRGAHHFWLGKGERVTSGSRPNGLINLVHYDDGAQCVVDALLKAPQLTDDQRLLLVSDGIPISRIDICHAALKCPIYAGKVAPDFQGSGDADGKKCDSSLVSSVVGWKPRFVSFEGFMEKEFDQEIDIDMFCLDGKYVN